LPLHVCLACDLSAEILVSYKWKWWPIPVLRLCMPSLPLHVCLAFVGLSYSHFIFVSAWPPQRNFFLYHLSMMGFAEAYLEGVREFTALLQCKLLLCIYCKRLSPLTVLVGEYIWEKGKSGDCISWWFSLGCWNGPHHSEIWIL